MPFKSINLLIYKYKVYLICIFSLSVSLSLSLSQYIYIYIYIYISCHAHRTDFPDSRHSSLSSIASGRSFRRHPVSVQICYWWVLVGQPILARLYEGVHSRMSFMTSSLLIQQCPACLVRLIRLVLEMRDTVVLWNNCFQDLLNIARSIFEQFSWSFFFSIR